MAIITFNIDASSGVHIYLQIYNYIKEEIKSGRLLCHTKLPSTRTLSAHLQVSRNTVEVAYGQLMDEGYIESRPKSGYFVSDIRNIIPTLTIDTVNPIPESTVNTADTAESGLPFQFSPYGIDLEHFPYSTWRKVMKEILYDDRNDSLFKAGDHQGDYDFREAIAGYLHQSRGVNCRADQIIVGAGIDYLVLLLAQLLSRSTHFAMEDPSYKRAYKILNQQKFPITMLPMDQHGMDISYLRRSTANIAYVTPSHHFPLGIVMPIKRRLELLAWANAAADRYIIEDDYDSEFRYKGKPIPSLQGIDSNQKVIYLGTFSKAVAPSMRMGYMVLPDNLVQIYRTRFDFIANTVPRIEQRQLTEFINQGYFERHLNRMRTIYKNKRDIILKELSDCSNIKISGENSGLHLLIHFTDGRTESDILSQAADVKIQLYGLSDFYIDSFTPRIPSTVLLGYATLTEEQLTEQVRLFKHKVIQS